MVEFISYDGGYPNRCSGDLVLKIDGKIHTLHNPLCSGGGIWFENGEEVVEYGPWYVDIPEDLLEYEKEILAVVDKNIPWGCCGGCI